jgi:hypothetical protein
MSDQHEWKFLCLNACSDLSQSSPILPFSNTALSRLSLQNSTQAQCTPVSHTCLPACHDSTLLCPSAATSKPCSQLVQ